VLAYSRAADGTLTPAGAYPTGGVGGALGSGHPIVASRNGRVVVAVNAGSNSITAFAAGAQGLRPIDTVPSNGLRPTSVTIDGDIVYVVNAGSLSIAGFRVEKNGLAPIAGSVQPLGAGAANVSQIQFDNSGKVLVVDERGSNTFDAFVVDAHGVAGPPITTQAAAGGPFGFDFDRANHLLASNTNLGGAFAGMAGASSYDVAKDGTLAPNGSGVPSGQTASCWLAAAKHWAYTTNAGSGSIGVFTVAGDGTMTLTDTVALGAGAHPLDDDATKSGDDLYVLVDGFHELAGFHVEHDGSLTPTGSVPVPAGAAGVAAA
jgi:6-phosphogluconolactonase